MPIENKWTLWAVAGGITLVVVVVLAVLTSVLHVSHSFPGPLDIVNLANLHEDQCETLKPDGVFAEPENTWSNVAYLLFGLLVLFRARSFVGRLLGAGIGAVGVASAGYHALPGELPAKPIPCFFPCEHCGVCTTGQTFPTTSGPLQEFDVISIYVVLLLLTLHALYSIAALFEVKLPTRSWLWFVLILLAYCGISGVSGWLRHCCVIGSTEGFGILVAPSAAALMAGIGASLVKGDGTEPLRVPMVNWQFGGAGFLGWQLFALAGVFGAGGLFRLNDGYNKGNGVVPKPLCSPNATLQPHALWHVFSALALLLAYDLFAQLQRQRDRRPADLPVILDDVRVVMATGGRRILALNTAFGAALMIASGVSDPFSLPLLVIGLMLFLADLAFLIVLLVRGT